MGSYNLKCALSGMPIHSDEEAICLVLKQNCPDDMKHRHKILLNPIKTMGQHFKIASLPIIGDYNSYGEIEPNNSCNLAIELLMNEKKSKKKSQNDALEFISENGDTYFENSNNYEDGDELNTKDNLRIFVHFSIFEKLLKSFDEKTILEQFHILIDSNCNCLTTELANFIDSQLSSRDGINNEISNSIKFFYNLYLLGYALQFKSEPLEDIQSKTYEKEHIFYKNFKFDNISPKLHNIFYKKFKFDNILPKLHKHDSSSSFRCAITGMPILPMERVLIIPIASNLMPHIDDTYMETEYSSSLYGIISNAILAQKNKNSNTFTILSDFNKNNINNSLLFKLPKENHSISDQQFLDNFLNHKYSQDTFWSKDVILDYMIVSELSAKKLIQISNIPDFVSDFEIFKDIIYDFLSIDFNNINPSTFLSFFEKHNVLPKYNSALKRLIYFFETTEERLNSHKAFELCLSYNFQEVFSTFRISQKDNLDEYHENSFIANFFNTEQSKKTILSYKSAYSFGEHLRNVFRETKSVGKNNKMIFFKEIEKRFFELLSTLELMAAFKYFNISISPSVSLNHNSTAAIQHEINSTIHSTAKQIIKKNEVSYEL